MLAIVLNIVHAIFKTNYNWMFSLNCLFILWLSSAALSSTLFSGGWALTLLLYWLFIPQLSETDLKENV